MREKTGQLSVANRKVLTRVKSRLNILALIKVKYDALLLIKHEYEKKSMIDKLINLALI